MVTEPKQTAKQVLPLPAFLTALQPFGPLSLADFLRDVPVGQTTHEIIWRRNKARLYHYPAQVTSRHAVPILMVYSLMNRPYILDLRPGASLIEFLLAQGYEVYLLDWGVPGPEDSNLTLADYVLEYLPRAVKHTLAHAHAPALTLFGYCLGATLALCYAALDVAAPLKNLVTIAAPIDFEEKGLLHNWLAAPDFDLDLIVKSYGIVPGQLLDLGTRLLKPYQNFVATYTDIWPKQNNPEAVIAWLSMQKWVNDGVPFAGAAFRQCVQDLYRDNKLIKGELCLNERRVDLSSITKPLLNVIARRDHIVLPSQSQALTTAVNSQDKQEMMLAGGHVGMVVGRNANRELWPALVDWLTDRSD